MSRIHVKGIITIVIHDAEPTKIAAIQVSIMAERAGTWLASTDRGGSSAGGNGIGAGLGKGGSGTGGGGITRARRIAGDIQRADYPRARKTNEVGGSVTAHFDVGADGRARNCRVVRSRGNSERDGITCRLIEQRFRFEPARDASGRPVADVAGWRQDWWPDG